MEQPTNQIHSSESTLLGTETLGLTSDLIDAIRDVAREGDSHTAHTLVLGLDGADQAEIFNMLSAEDTEKIAALLGDDFPHEVLPELDAETAEDVLHGLGSQKTAEAIAELDTEDAVQLIEDLPEGDKQEILETVDKNTRQELEEGLAYPDSSAGRLMRKKMVCIPLYWTVGDTIDYLRSHPDLPDDFYVIFVVDPKFHPVGELLLAKIMQHKREIPVSEIMNAKPKTLGTHTDQEEVAYLFRKYALVEAPVLNEEGRLMGTITIDDVVYVMQEEQEEDFMKAGGVHGQEFHAGLFKAAGTRFPWLFINLLTAIAASAIIDLYQETIEQLVILAVLMPIIASMGGNAGIQSATVAVRAMAMRRIAPGSEARMVAKEAALGALNGLGLALITGLGIYLLYGDMLIASIFATATIITMVIAGFSGVMLPMLMVKFKIDPAISSGVFLTMLTDMVGFFAFLGLAAVVVG